MEFNTNQINIMLDALEHYGNGPQVDMAIEEMSELTKELLKDRISIHLMLLLNPSK